MKLILAAAAAIIVAPTAQAQTSYNYGYHDGYYDRIPLSGPPDRSTEYGRGWHTGQDDSYEDIYHYNRNMNQNPYDPK